MNTSTTTTSVSDIQPEMLLVRGSVQEVTDIKISEGIYCLTLVDINSQAVTEEPFEKHEQVEVANL